MSYKLNLFLFVCLYFYSFVNSSEIEFQENENNTTDIIVKFQKKLLNSLGEEFFSFEKNGLHLWINNKNQLMYYYIDDYFVVNVYQYPSTSISPYLDYDKYSKEREEKMKNASYKKCSDTKKINEKSFFELQRMLLIGVNDLFIINHCRYHSNVGKKLYFGYIKQNDFIKYFYFHDFREKGISLKKPISNYLAVLKILNNEPFNHVMDDCQ